MRRVLAAAAVVILATACGDDGRTALPEASPATVTSTTEDPAAARRAHSDAVERIVTDALRVASETPDTPANSFGWSTRASAYRAIAANLKALNPPPAVSTEHQFLIAEATALADDAERVGRTPIANRQSAGFVHFARAREFEERVAALAD